MHTGSIAETSQGVAARLYRVMRGARRWMTGLELQDAVRTTAVATRISEIRRQLPADERIETKQVGRRFYYRWEKIKTAQHSGQLGMFPGDEPKIQRVPVYETGINSAARNHRREAATRGQC